jgi:hypothetical protein
MLNERRYNEHRQSFDASIMAPVDGIPINLGANWREARQRTEDIRRNFRFERTSENDSRFYESRVEEAAFAAYKACIQSDMTGLFILLEKDLPDSIKVRVLYKTDHYDRPRKLRVAVKKGATLAQDDEIPITGPMDETFTFYRTSADEPILISTQVLQRQLNCPEFLGGWLV